MSSTGDIGYSGSMSHDLLVPIFRIYEDEVRDLPRPKHNQSKQQYYDTTLCSFPVGSFGEAQPVGGESLQSVSHQLHEACTRNGVDVWIISANRGVLFFKIVEQSQLELNLDGTEPSNL